MPNLDGPDALLPAFLLARRLGVSRQLVNYWHKNGKLEAAGQGVDGRPLFRLLDGARLEADMRANPQSRRGPRRSDWADLNRKTDAGPSAINAAA